MTSFSTQSYRCYLKFLRCLGCLSSVWILALTGCGAKHSAQLPLAEQDSIRFEAKAAAATDAKTDAGVLASFRAGMSATFAAAMCGLLTGLVADATLGQGQDALFYFTASMSAAGSFSLLLRYHIRPPNPPPERLIGKSAEYVRFYADAYQARMRSYQMKSVAAGSIFGCLTLTGGIAIIASHIEAER